MRLAGLPAGVLAALGALVVVQLTLQVIAVVQLTRTPAARVTMGGRKWLWALIIVFGEIAGPIVWFVAGRSQAPVDQWSVDGTPGVPGADDRSTAVDALYGPRGGK